MRPVLCVLLMQFGGVTLAVATPPHPTLLFAEYKREQCPVVAADDGQPVVLYQGARKTLPESTAPITERAARYLPVVATNGGPGITKREQVDYKILGSTTPREAERYECELVITAQADLDDCYLLATSFARDWLDDPKIQPNIRVYVREVGSLRAGVPRTVKFTGELMLPIRYTHLPAAAAPLFQMITFWQLFSGGKEVKCELSPFAAQFYQTRERAVHRAAVDLWKKQHRGADRAAQLFLQIPPLLPEDDTQPGDAVATLEIGTDGVVRSVTLEPELTDETGEVLRDTLQAWLFLPKLNAGVAAPTRATVPLRL